ncbi:cyclin-dependent kinase 2-associated protein 1-like [Malaya genurostris]|uniref:cyclin-dependent kinase 2-associated protein 1-like n=1 Tax=Malaya genurostris TaxID=325434 RepID=UPI0026F3D20E|nr:cyclin-dependent kinase 2-associated protein 1-like [Malaya genurostris]
MDYVDIQAVESKLTDVTVTAIPIATKNSTSKSNLCIGHGNQQLHPQHSQSQNLSSIVAIPTINATPVSNMNQFSIGCNTSLTKYAQLLMVIEEMGRDIRPTYSGSRSSAERLKRGIVHARILVRECLLETERSARQ